MAIPDSHSHRANPSNTQVGACQSAVVPTPPHTVPRRQRVHAVLSPWLYCVCACGDGRDKATENVKHLLHP